MAWKSVGLRWYFVERSIVVAVLAALGSFASLAVAAEDATATGGKAPQENEAAQAEAKKQDAKEPEKPQNPTMYGAKVAPSELSRPYYFGFPGGPILLPPPDFRDLQGEAVYQNFPLTPKQIEELRRMQMDIERAKVKPIINPKMVSRAIHIDMGTGAAMPKVQIAPGYVTTLVLVDAAGEPWPLGANPVLGDGASFSVSVPDGARNIINLTANALSARTTLSLIPESDNPVPIVLEIEASDRQHDTRVDLLLPEYRKGAPPLVDRAPRNPADERMLAFVAGTPPQGSVALEVMPTDAPLRAWYYDGEVYVRSANQLISPAWSGEANGVGGVRVYRMAPANSILYYQDGVVKEAIVRLDAIRFSQATSE